MIFILREFKPYEIIRKQINYDRLTIMIGAYNPMYSNDGKTFSFRFKAKNSKANYMEITLTRHDTYDIRFLMIRNLDFTNEKIFKDIYVNQIMEIFENYTGLSSHI